MLKTLLKQLKLRILHGRLLPIASCLSALINQVVTDPLVGMVTGSRPNPRIPKTTQLLRDIIATLITVILLEHVEVSQDVEAFLIAKVDRVVFVDANDALLEVV